MQTAPRWKSSEMPEASSHEDKPFKDGTETSDISRITLKRGGFAKTLGVYTREILRL
jgi:hypothetical protein